MATQKLTRSPGHPFYERLNQVLEIAGFDAFVEGRCERFYASGIGRPGQRPVVCRTESWRIILRLLGRKGPFDRLESALKALLVVVPARFEVFGFPDPSINHLHVRLQKER